MDGGLSEPELLAEVANYCTHWRHRLLTSVGIEPLPASLKTTLEELDLEFGHIDRPIAPSWEVIAVPFERKRASLTATEVRGMSDVAIVEHLGTWQPEPGPGFPPTRSVLGHVLTAVLTEPPDRLSTAGDALQALHPVYLRAIAFEDGALRPAEPAATRQ